MKIEEWVDLTLPKSKCTILYHILVFLSAQTQIILKNPHWYHGYVVSMEQIPRNLHVY